MEEIFSYLKELHKMEEINLTFFSKKKTKERVYYNCVNIDMNQDEIKDILKDISNHYTSTFLKDFEEMMKYSGVLEKTKISTIDVKNDLIKEDYDSFLSNLMRKDHETFSLNNKYNGFIITGRLLKDSIEKNIKIITIQNPIKKFKRKKFFLIFNGKYKKIDENVLCISHQIDILVIDNTLYFLGFNGEKFFDLERSYVKITKECLKEYIINNDIILDYKSFEKEAISYNNSRKLYNFNKKIWILLQNKEKRNKIFDKFDIELIDGKVDTSKKENSKKFINLLSGRGAIGLDDAALEISNSKKWEKSKR